MNFYQFLDRWDNLVESDGYQTWEAVVFGILLLILLIRILIDKVRRMYGSR